MNLSSTSTKSAHSAMQRLRYWSTAFFFAAILTSTALLSFGHLVHGTLMLLASGTLLRHTVLDRRARRQEAVNRFRRAYYAASGASGAGQIASK